MYKDQIVVLFTYPDTFNAYKWMKDNQQNVEKGVIAGKNQIAAFMDMVLASTVCGDKKFTSAICTVAKQFKHSAFEEMKVIFPGHVGHD